MDEYSTTKLLSLNSVIISSDTNPSLQPMLTYYQLNSEGQNSVKL